MIEQFTPPNKLTKEPYGTLMKVYTGEEPIYWVQTSLKTYLPKWKSMNMILCTVFSDILGNDMNVSEEFVDCCIDFVKKIRSIQPVKQHTMIGLLAKTKSSSPLESLDPEIDFDMSSWSSQAFLKTCEPAPHYVWLMI